MEMPSRRCLSALLLSCMLPLTTPSASAQPPRYRLTEIGVLQGLVTSHVVSINNAGQIAGNSFDDANRPTPFLYTDGQLVALPGSEPGFRAWAINGSGVIAGATDGGRSFRYADGTITFLGPATPDDSARSMTFDMNESGTIVGASTGNGRPWRTFVAEGDITHELDIPGESLGYAINNHGDVTGVLRSYGSHRAFAYSNGSLIEINPGSTYTVPTDINDAGVIVGQAGSHAFIYQDGAIRRLAPRSQWLESFAMGINNLGQVIGTARPDPRSSLAFLWEHGTAYDLRDLVDMPSEWDSIVVTDINDVGQIIGRGCATDCVSFVLTPVPEPFMAALLAPGLGLLGMRLRHRA